jgi:hypothetical protein
MVATYILSLREMCTSGGHRDGLPLPCILFIISVCEKSSVIKHGIKQNSTEQVILRSTLQ